jgi:6-phosphogluconolactonase
MSGVMPDTTSLRLHHYPSNAELTAALYRRVARLSRHCIDTKGQFSMVLAGGSTPQRLYQQLRQLDTEWRCWHIYFGDERVLPAGDPERNDSMADLAWLAHVPIPTNQVHRVQAAISANAAAIAYEASLQQASCLDLVLLGLGEDGHTASLFPGAGATEPDSRLAVGILDAPKPPPQRVSLTARCLSRGEKVWFIVSGEAKRPALQDWLGGVELPAATIRPNAGVDIFTDITL